ncbi:hypothetical protein [Mesorhizobium sp. M0129]|uniref:hypothetical protein n=1 Tax=Mesorhizobium sp. M0129 TaxID=2956886 RepID=UPI00333AC390
MATEDLVDIEHRLRIDIENLRKTKATLEAQVEVLNHAVRAAYEKLDATRGHA